MKRVMTESGTKRTIDECSSWVTDNIIQQIDRHLAQVDMGNGRILNTWSGGFSTTVEQEIPIRRTGHVGRSFAYSERRIVGGSGEGDLITRVYTSLQKHVEINTGSRSSGAWSCRRSRSQRQQTVTTPRLV